MSIAPALGLAAALIIGGLILGAWFDAPWYFRLIPLGIGLAAGAVLVQRRARQ